MNSKIKHIINDLKKGKTNMSDIPQEFQFEPNIVKIERELGLRKSEHRGFDVLSQLFFVEEGQNTIAFNTFEEYYHFLDGDIYNDSCYFQYDFSDEFSKKLNLDNTKLLSKKSFTTDTIDESLYEKNEIKEYKKIEKVQKKKTKEWIQKFNSCRSYNQLKKTCNYCTRTNLDLDFFLFEYLFYWQNNQGQLDILKKYLWNDDSFNTNIILAFYLLNPSSDIIEQYSCPKYADSTNSNKKSKLRRIVKIIQKEGFKKQINCYFDEETHFYCEKTTIIPYANDSIGIYFIRPFETFDEFTKYRNGDLRNCDFSNAIDLNIDYSKYITDHTTQLAIKTNDNLEYHVKKEYSDNKFIVEQYWSRKSDEYSKKRKYEFKYFFDFVAFLNGDLSNANLIFCDKLINLSNTDGINLKNAKIRSDICKKFDIPYTPFDYDEKLLKEFQIIEKNELKIIPDLHKSINLALCECSSQAEFMTRIDSEIAYISDLHLLRRIKNAHCKSKEDVIYVLQNIVNNIVEVKNRFILIAGDTSSDFLLFELFVQLLKDNNNNYHEFIFILGNHELWPFPSTNLDDIVEKYKILFQANNMHLLQNDLLYYNENIGVKIIPYDELISLSKSDILKNTRYSRFVILGGIGFSGYNESFNENNGIYQGTIDRSKEILESKKFEQLYNKLTDILEKSNPIILTHMPKSDWSKDSDYHNHFVYVSGHTHKNFFFDDGIQRIYADNQVGYKNENIHLKIIVMDGNYDYFEDYEDGIYEISTEDYKRFYLGKNIEMTCTREMNVLYMLKKKGYYCFIHKSKSGVLMLLNGGNMKTLSMKDIQYYYDNMDHTIDIINEPFEKYSACQEKLANMIQKIGGIGKIHGCIIDIDPFNHIYVNPIDMTITAYFAFDTINKYAYPSIPKLLECHCPSLYKNYEKLIGTTQLEKTEEINETSISSVEYLETDIYTISREVKKMQKLNFNILTFWYEKPNKKLR